MFTDTQIQVIKDNQQKSIQAKRLVAEQLELIYDNNWFNVWVPKIYGGMELSLPKGMALLEELAYWDGGLAWTTTLCSGANMFAGYIHPDTAKQVFMQREVCLGGSGRVGGNAVWDGKTYNISGTWQYATGAPHLTHFTLNCFIYHDSVQQFDEEGKPLVCSFFVPRDLVLVHYDWDTFGLECTASHNFSLDNVEVDPRYIFQLIPEKRFYNSPLFKIPFATFAELTLWSNYFGMYRRFLDLVEKFFFEKAKDAVWAENYSKERFKLLDRLQIQALVDQKNIYELTGQLWNNLVAKEEVISEQAILTEIASETRLVVKRIREHVVNLFPLVGITGAQRENELNIVFRNIFTASQHSLLYMA